MRYNIYYSPVRYKQVAVDSGEEEEERATVLISTRGEESETVVPGEGLVTTAPIASSTPSHPTEAEGDVRRVVPATPVTETGDTFVTPAALLVQLLAYWDGSGDVSWQEGRGADGEWDNSLTALLPPVNPTRRITFWPYQADRPPRVVALGEGGEEAPPPNPDLEEFLRDHPPAPVPPEWQSPEDESRRTATNAEPQDTTTAPAHTQRWGGLQSRTKYKEKARGEANATRPPPDGEMGYYTRAERTPPSAGRPRETRDSRQGRPPSAARVLGSPLEDPSDAPPVWLPWWFVTGREPNRLERWAAFLLPPLSMGEEFAATGGDISSRLRVVGPDTYDVIASVTTRYRLLTARRRRTPGSARKVSCRSYTYNQISDRDVRPARVEEGGPVQVPHRK